MIHLKDIFIKKEAIVRKTFLILVFINLIASSTVIAQSMVCDGLTGPVTQNEIDAFKNYMVAKVQPPATGTGNIWVYGNSGKAIEACGLMYETSHDIAILDRMIFYCDAALAGRNDLASAANGGQLLTWTNQIDPVWPSSTDYPAGAGVEQGEILSHMAFCSKLILQNPAIWNTPVGIGDPDGYGATYKERALKYIKEGDYVMDKWILPRFIRTSESNHYYFPGAPNTYKPNEPAPWNQAWMLTNGFVRLTECHLLLGDDSTRVAKYDSIVKPNIDWFFANLKPNTSAKGTSCWIWAYALPTGTEDANHFAYDAEGLWIAFQSGRYGIKYSDLVPFANTYFDVILSTVTGGIYAGRVDGTTGTGNAGGDNYVRDEYIYLTEFRPDKFLTVGNIEISTNKIPSSPQITARLLWEKARRNAGGLVNASSLVSYDTNGKLVYKADAKGNTVPDFSGVGYKNSEANIPNNIKIVKTVTPVAGDNLQNIQGAINEVAAMPLDADGFRGEILFKKGVYNISSTINVNASGIVLMGEGSDANGTRFIATATTQSDLIKIAGTSGVSTDETTAKKVTDLYVPYGINKVTVEAGHNFHVGDWVYFRRVPNQAWIDLLNTAQYGWTPSAYKVNYERQITRIDGNVIYFDAPIVDYIDPTYSDGYVVKINLNRIQNCGIENIRFASTYTALDDENHGWNAVFFDKIINGWARNLEVYYFGYAAVNLGEQSRWMTVDNCKMLDPMSQTTGGRKYSFNNDGQRNLVKNCITRGGRHDYVDGSCTAGPSVFVNSKATSEFADIGPHHRWSTGILFDNIVSDGNINVQNRENSGSGHGWAGSQTMFWNCDVPHMIVQKPPADHINWSIGCNATITNVGDWTTEPAGFIESKGAHVTPASLYEAQLADRLVPAVPAPPTYAQATAISGNQINLTWFDESYNEDLFRIERSSDKGTTWNTLTITDPNTKSFTDAGIGDTITYYYRVRAENNAGNSDYSNITKASTRLIPIPDPWQHQDIGAPTATGSANYADGKFFVNGSGTDIYGTSDQCHFVYQPLKGNGEISAQVINITNTNVWAKAGVMIRESLNANSANAFMLVSSSSGIALQQRPSTGSASSTTKATGVSPFWVKLVRNNNVLTGYESSEGNIWWKIGDVTIPMAQDVYIGVAVSSHVSGTICPVRFDNVTVTKDSPVGIDDSKDQSIQKLTVMPNPINSTARILYYIPNTGMSRLSIYDLKGTEIKTLVDKSLLIGNYECQLDTSDIPNGTYLVRLVTATSYETYKIVVIK
ncbi:MAG: T9SS type A sorting domain-containing protein [Bacteroidota bacterium]|nr:T9SS type A sorting domain-containing protein [Bacteroidota bacterium]